jgi:hypothetical protein
MTCGAPVCRVVDGDAGPLTNDGGAPCPPLGSSCSVQGQTCGDPATARCGAVEICDTQPQRICPVSSRKFKDDIQYVDSAGLKQLHDETIGIHLATYNYKAQVADPNPRHLGFIIEDRPPQSTAVDWSHERVDLYGYLSMVVATIKVQEEEIAELRQELARARQGVCLAPNGSRSLP